MLKSDHWGGAQKEVPRAVISPAVKFRQLFRKAGFET
jgi:hypothetical protein